MMNQVNRQPSAVIAKGIEDEARWRRERAAEHPDDPRNLRCAEGLEELAAYVRSLPHYDERLRELMTLSSVDDVFSLPVADGVGAGGEARRALSQFRFHDPTQDCDAFLSELVTMASRDAVQMARAAGLLDDAEDDPDAGFGR